MGLYNSLTALLKRYDGEMNIDDVCSFFEEDYSRKAILDFLAHNENTFKFDGINITSFQIRIDIFLEELKILILKHHPSSKIIKHVIIDRLLQFCEKNSFNNLPDFDLKRTEDVFFETDVDERLTWYEEFFTTEENKYQFTLQVIEFLIEEEFVNSGIYSTPQTIIKLFNNFLPEKVELKVYNPTAGFLNLSTALKIYSKSKIKLLASEIDKRIHYYGELFSTLNNFKVDYKCIDSGEEIILLNDSEFDVIVSNLPFSVKTSKYSFSKRQYKELSMHIITESLRKLKQLGRAFFLVNDGILFSNYGEATRFRKEIVESGMLKTIISLPSKIMTQSQVKSSVLVFEKGNYYNEIQFIDASSKELFSLNPDKSISLHTEKISSLIDWSSHQYSSQVNEPTQFYKNNKTVVNVPIKDIRKYAFELSIGRYVANKMEFGEQYVSLGDVCTVSKTSSIKEDISYPFIRITELNSDNIIVNDINLHNSTNRKGKLLDKPAFLIGTIDGSFKPSFFDGSYKIEVSNNVVTLDFKKERIYPPYLLQELNSDYVLNQMKILTKGSAIKRINSKDLLTIKVKIPTIEEQKRIYIERTSFESEHQFIQVQADKTISDAEVFKVFKHEIGNILRRPEGFLEILPDFLLKNNISLNAPVVEGQPETIGDMVNVSLKKLNQIHWLMESLKGILFADKKYFKPELTELKPFIIDCLENEIQNNEMTWYVVVDGDYKSKKKYFAEIDRRQFENVIRNFVVNALTHGRNENNLHFVVDIMSFQEYDKTDNSIQIEFINDGNPLPSDFRIQDFTKFGKKIGESTGHGLGGYLINQVVKNHNGYLDIIPPGNNVEVEKGNIILSKVNFFITIPKNQ
jgi:type I restriction enzyme M protein